MFDVIKIHLKRSITTRSGKGNQPLNIKTAVEQPFFLGLPNVAVFFITKKIFIVTITEKRQITETAGVYGGKRRLAAKIYIFNCLLSQ